MDVPNVPNVPGVPALNRVSLASAVAGVNSAAAAANAAVGLLGGSVPAATVTLGQVNAAVSSLNFASASFGGASITALSPLGMAETALASASSAFGSVAAIAPSLGASAAALSSATGILSSSLTGLGRVSSLLGQDSGGAAALPGSTSAPQWGIFDSTGNIVLVGDAVLNLDLLADSKIADYPIEDGGFQSYNKVAMPTEGRIAITKGGAYSDRQAFISAIHALRTGLTLYSLVMPESHQPNMNVLGVRYDRSNGNGNQLITAELHLREVRTGAAAAFSNTVDPTSSAPQSTGSVQAQTPTTAQSAQMTGAH